VAFAFAIIIESPVIMIMSAATALAEDGPNFRRLRRFTYALNFVITAFQVILLATPLFGWVAHDVMKLPPEVERLTHISLWILLPWPGAIGYRRLYQGLLIRSGMTRRVAYGTVVRLSTMAVTGLLLYRGTGLAGAWVGAGALSAGVCMEALASRWMARTAMRDLMEPASSERTLSYRGIGRFYVPLAMTSTISLAAYPVVTLFMGHAPYSLESLAVLPVVNSLSFIFRSPALAYHDVVIALMDPAWKRMRPLMSFAAGLALAVSAGMALIAFTPLSRFWFSTVSGLHPDLVRFALTPTRILSLLPALSVLLAVERAILVSGRHTDPITWATALELSGIALLLWAAIALTDWPGATCAAVAYLGGRFLSNTMLILPVLRRVRPAAGEDDDRRPEASLESR